MEPQPAAIVVEESQRLSRSILWRVQRSFFERQGVDAWRKARVPQYVTTNPFIAQAYARVALGFLRDLRTAGETRPLHIVELGSGTGRFAWHFVRKLLALVDELDWPPPVFRYVMTDLVERNVDFWRGHAALGPLTDAGVLDFALFDAERDQSLTLSRAGTVLGPGASPGPLLVIANYVLDSLPQDAFHVQRGTLRESLVTVRARAGVDLDEPGALEACEVAFADAPAPTTAPYDDPTCNEVLADCARRLADTHLVFPSTAVRCIERLAAIAGGRLLLLAADYGDVREDALLYREEPTLRLHNGCFSVGVNFHALGRWCERKGGAFLSPAQPHGSLCIVAAFLGLDDRRETRLAYREWIEAVSPDDFYSLKKGLDRAYELMTLQQLSAYLRLSAWDSDILRECMTALVVRVEGASERELAELHETLRQVWQQHYQMGDERALLHHLAVLHYKMRYYPDALRLCELALRDYGPHVETYFDMAMALYRLRRLEDALAAATQALALAPDEEGCRALRVRLENELGRTTR